MRKFREEKKSTCNRFHEQKVSSQQVPWPKKVTRNKSYERNQFHEEKNQYTQY